ncbi:MAG: hypothetical protein F4X98_08300 [Gammaproteobacteria bacterium]|nr:hypothetical protein [Gammaproteobacteria bacterium]
MAYKSLSGSARSALGALTSYGLLERVEKGMVKVSERAKAILHPLPGEEHERTDNLRAAATSPPVFQKIRNVIGDSDAPPKGAIESVLKREGFAKAAAAAAASAYLETLAFLQAEEVAAVGEVEAKEESDEVEDAEPAKQLPGQHDPLNMPSGEYKQALGALVGDGVYASVLVNGPFGPDEIENLIVYLQLQQKILQRPDGIGRGHDVREAMIVAPAE